MLSYCQSKSFNSMESYHFYYMNQILRQKALVLPIFIFYILKYNNYLTISNFTKLIFFILDFFIINVSSKEKMYIYLVLT